ncbi:serine/threonine-protein kinase [Legionella gratiana]|uniref:Serine/threonine-protein kinase n=1 Tax=Legionella gratiana TaxID=45066 RepID=A0A378JCV2_9GAMM|nr:protein kinase [Legionella gratiana]KTD06358.1 serine/threonine-protein kinase [Legionella gratiana]STX45176.1 serine/threonine-protein kinase [Legionella gratiana]
MLTINPAQISLEHSQKLANFFNSQASEIKVWKEGQIFAFEDGIQFKFTSDVVRRDRKENKSGYRYEFISNRLLGKGQFGEVYEIEGTLAVSSNGVQFKPHGLNGKTRAVKIQKHNISNPVEAALQEYNLAKGATHLGIKKPTVEGETSYTVMKKLKGKELFDVLFADYNNSQILTLTQRFELTQLLLKALKEQVTDRGIIHRDIKGENIFIDLESNPIQVNIFDFGLSVDANRLDGKCPGTLAYAPPELFENARQTTKIDVFSLGRVLALLWRVDVSSYSPLSVNAAYHNALNVRLDSLFSGIDLDEPNKQIIRTMLQGMMRADIDSRFTIEQAIALFSQVNLNNHIVNHEKEDINNDKSTFSERERNYISRKLKDIQYQIDRLNKNQSDLDDTQKETLAELVQKLNTNVNALTTMANEKNAKKNFSIKVEETQHLISSKKEIFENTTAGYILANIAVGLLTVGIAHLALAAHSVFTGKNDFGFFKELKSTYDSILCEEINENLEELNKQACPK